MKNCVFFGGLFLLLSLAITDKSSPNHFGTHVFMVIILIFVIAAGIEKIKIFIKKENE